MLATTALAGWTGFASAQQQETLTLPTIDVQSANDNGTVGYLATRTSSATKTNTPLLDIPQSISIMTRQQINDIGALKLEDVVRYMPGVLWHQGENIATRSSFGVRVPAPIFLSTACATTRRFFETSIAPSASRYSKARML